MESNKNKKLYSFKHHVNFIVSVFVQIEESLCLKGHNHTLPLPPLGIAPICVVRNLSRHSLLFFTNHAPTTTSTYIAWFLLTYL